MQAGLATMHPEKLSPDLRHFLDDIQHVAMHPEKMSRDMQYRMRKANRLLDNDGEWLIVDSRFAAIYMTSLAALLAKETDLAALTNEEPSLGVNLHSLLEEVKPSAPSDKKGALVSFAMEAIRIDPTTRIDKLLTFRRSRETQLAELSSQFEDLSSKIATCESSAELEEKARDTYVTRIRPKLESLRQELKDGSIQFCLGRFSASSDNFGASRWRSCILHWSDRTDVASRWSRACGHRRRDKGPPCPEEGAPRVSLHILARRRTQIFSGILMAKSRSADVESCVIEDANRVKASAQRRWHPQLATRCAGRKKRTMTRSELKEGFARLGPTRDIDLVPCGSNEVILLRLGPDIRLAKTISATLALRKRHVPMLKAKRAIEAAFAKNSVVLVVPMVEDLTRLAAELAIAR
jgi:hypothetical protein